MRRNNTPLKLKTPHLLKLNINKTKGVTNATKLNIQKEHFHFFKMQKSPMNNTKEKNYITTENEQLSNKNQKLKLISSNGQNYFCFNQNKGESGIKIISKKEPSELPYMNTDYRTKTLNTINSDCISMNQYRKLSKEQIQRIRQLKTMNTITHTNTLTDSSITKDETKSRMERSKSTLNTKSISLRNNKLKVLKRSLSNKRNVLKILDDTIKGLTKLKTIILDDEEEEEYKYDDDEVDFEKEASYKNKRNKIKQKLQNGIMNMNELINSSFTGELIHKEAKRQMNLTLDMDTPKRKRNEKIVINMENHKNLSSTTQHKKNKSLYSNYNYNIFKEKKEKEKSHSIIRVDNVDKEVPIKIKTVQRNNSELVKNIMSVNKTLNKMKKRELGTSSSNIFRKSNRYSDSDTLANFEFVD